MGLLGTLRIYGCFVCLFAFVGVAEITKSHPKSPPLCVITNGSFMPAKPITICLLHASCTPAKPVTKQNLFIFLRGYKK
jgi:hypothetical protein